MSEELDLELDKNKIYKIKDVIDRYLDQEGSIYAKYLEACLECSGYEAVYVASLYPDQYSLYYTKRGWYKDSDYIISISDRPINLIYVDLLSWDEKASLTEFVKEVYIVDDYCEPNSKSIAETGESGFFLDESIKQPKQKQTYNYDGPISRFGKLFASNWKGQTQAVSEKQALNNLTYKAKIENNLIGTAKLELDPKCLSCDDIPPVYPETYHEINYCDKCGTRLNDGGTCPICDDGEEDY